MAVEWRPVVGYEGRYLISNTGFVWIVSKQLDLSNGQVREVRAYTEADRPLLERVWREYYAPMTLDSIGAS